MRTRTWLGVGAAFACGALLTAVGIGWGEGGAASSLFTPPNGPYVALGDSYTVSPKIPGQTGSPRAVAAPIGTIRRRSRTGSVWRQPSSAT